MLAAPLAVATAVADKQCTPPSLYSNGRQFRSRFALWRVSFALAAQPRMTCPLLDDSAPVASTRARARDVIPHHCLLTPPSLCNSTHLSHFVLPRDCSHDATIRLELQMPCKDAVDRFLLAHCMACVIRRGAATNARQMCLSEPMTY